MKNLVKKTCPSKTVRKERFFKAHLEYRKDGLSPAQRLFGRPTRTKLPAHQVVYKKDIQDAKDQHDGRAHKLERWSRGRWSGCSIT